MVYVHPILGIVGVLLMSWLAIQGFRSRHPAAYATGARRAHRRASQAILLLWAATLATGWISSAVLRDDLEAGRSVHFAVGWTSLGLFVGSWWLSRRFKDAPWGRRVHPWLGLAGLACAVALAVLGMRLLP